MAIVLIIVELLSDIFFLLILFWIIPHVYFLKHVQWISLR